MSPSFIASILFVLAVLFVVAEVFVHSYGVLGFLGALAIGGYIYFSIQTGYVSSIEIILFVVGLVLVSFALFIPGFDIPGLIGAILLFVAVVQAARSPGLGLTTLVTGLLAGAGLGFILVKAGFTSKLFTKSILKKQLTAEEGFLARKNLDELLGEEGITLTPLRPSGTVLIGDRRLDAISQAEFIGSHVPIVVYEVSDGRLLVRPSQPPKEGDAQ